MQGEFWFNEHVYADPLIVRPVFFTWYSRTSSSRTSPAVGSYKKFALETRQSRKITLGEKAMVNLPKSNYLPVDLSTNFDVSSNETESSRMKSIHSIP